MVASPSSTGTPTEGILTRIYSVLAASYVNAHYEKVVEYLCP